MFQKALYEKGFYGGHWDGHYGPMTKAAVRYFQASQGLPVDGEPTPETLKALGF
jgi:peptidoglycan hydrolase-like protein with peptidoglycan-binding domain